MKQDILILGAGPAGMSCASKLSDNNFKPIIIEKDSKVGGLAKTVEFREGNYLFRTDLGPHRFYSKNQDLYDFIEGLLKDKWIVVNRLTRQYIDGKFFDYPINAMQAFKNIGLFKAISIAFSYFYARVQYGLFRKKINNFEDYIVANFGRVLGNFNMLNYTEKIWGIPNNKLSADFGKQRIKGLNLTNAAFNALFKSFKKNKPKSLVDQFYYPITGTGLIYESIEKKITKKGTKVYKNSTPTKIFHKNNQITHIEADINGKKDTFKLDKIVNTIPMTSFVHMLFPKPPKEVLNTIKKMDWRSHVSLFITLDKDHITKDNWIYFPSKKLPFARATEMKNFSKEMSPKGKTSFFVEFFVQEGDKIWNMSKKDLFEYTFKYFEKMNFFKRSQVRNYYVFKRNYVYPVYDLKYLDKIRVVENYLNKFENLYYAGRPARYRYNNQDHSLEMGFLAGQSIVDNKKYDISKVGMDTEYVEKGKLKK